LTPAVTSVLLAGMAHHAHTLLGSYATPLFRYGQVVTCAIRGDAQIVGLSQGLIPWPIGKKPHGKKPHGKKPHGKNKRQRFLTDVQVKTLHKIHSDYVTKIAELERQIERLKAEQPKEMEKVLTAAQLKRLTELKTGERVPGK